MNGNDYVPMKRWENITQAKTTSHKGNERKDDHMGIEKMEALVEGMIPKMTEVFTEELKSMDISPEKREILEGYLNFLKTPAGVRFFVETMNDPSGGHYAEMIRNIDTLKQTIRDLPNGGVIKTGDGEEARKSFEKAMGNAGENIKRRNRMIKNLEEIQTEIQHAKGYFDRLEETIQEMKGSD